MEMPEIEENKKEIAEPITEPGVQAMESHDPVHEVVVASTETKEISLKLELKNEEFMHDEGKGVAIAPACVEKFSTAEDMNKGQEVDAVDVMGYTDEATALTLTAEDVELDAASVVEEAGNPQTQRKLRISHQSTYSQDTVGTYSTSESNTEHYNKNLPEFEAEPVDGDACKLGVVVPHAVVDVSLGKGLGVPTSLLAKPETARDGAVFVLVDGQQLQSRVCHVGSPELRVQRDHDQSHQVSVIHGAGKFGKVDALHKGL